jgi:hypothetical protein
MAAADLIASLNRRQTAAESARQFVLLVAGIATIALFHVSGHCATEGLPIASLA